MSRIRGGASPSRSRTVASPLALPSSSRSSHSSRYDEIIEICLSTNTSTSFPPSPTATTNNILFSPIAALTRLFLPRGQLPVDYLTFQALDSAQALCSYLRGVLAMHATLEGLGLNGSSSSSGALAATLVLLLKEGASHIASLAFAFVAASRLDSEVRAWRLFADIANDVGLALELAAPRLGGAQTFAIVSAIANACKAVCGVAAGATRVAVSAHFARAGARARGGGGAAAVAEVAAKEGTQETAVTLLGLMLGATLAGALNASPSAQWTAFTFLTILHVIFNAAAVRSLALETLSRTRAKALLDVWRSEGKIQLPSPGAARVNEPLWPVQWGFGGGGGERIDGGNIRLGVPLSAFTKAVSNSGSGGGGKDWMTVVTVNGTTTTTLFDFLHKNNTKNNNREEGDDFCLLLHASSLSSSSSSHTPTLVAFGADASPRTMLQGWMLAACCGKVEIDETVSFLKSAEKSGWDLETTALEEEGFRVRLKSGGRGR